MKNILSLMIISTVFLAQSVQSALADGKTAIETQKLNADRPAIKFPDSFMIGISTNDPGLNFTEVLYYDRKAGKVRSQVSYSLLGLEPTKLVDIVLDEANKQIAFQGENTGDCKYTTFHESLAPIGLFFNMFSALTDYKGLDENNLHIFQVKKFITKTTNTNFIFFFDQNSIFQKARIEKNIQVSDYSALLMKNSYDESLNELVENLDETYEFVYDFDAVLPLEGQKFRAEDWQQKDCEPIDSSILMDGNSYVSFMYDFAITLMGSEEAILDYLGIPHNYKDYLNVGKKPSGDADDEAFDEEEEEEEKTFMQK